MTMSGVAFAAVVALTIALAAAYEMKWLNKVLPAKWQKEGLTSTYKPKLCKYPWPACLGDDDCICIGPF
jgi:hypothetical protein